MQELFAQSNHRCNHAKDEFMSGSTMSAPTKNRKAKNLNDLARLDIILSTLHGSHSARTEELFYLCKKNGYAMSRRTFARDLDDLASMQKISRISFVSQSGKYSEVRKVLQ